MIWDCHPAEFPQSINPKARWPQNWKTVWTAEMLLLSHLNLAKSSAEFPRLFEIVKQTLFAPESTAGIERIFSVAGYILIERRNRTFDENFENQFFANVNIDLPLSGVRKKLKLN